MQLHDYEAWLVGQGLSSNTVRQRIGFASNRIADWGTFDQPAEKIATWLACYSGWSRRTYLLHLRSVYAWLEETSQVVPNPTSRIKQTPCPAPRPRPLSRAQVDAALELARRDEAAWIKLGCLAGLRAHEIAKFRGDDISEDSIWVMGKGGQGAMVPTHPDLWALATEWPSEGFWFPGRGTSGHVATETVTERIAALLRRIGVASGSIHRCRATYGTELLRSGANIRVVQELMRHRSLSSTAHYLGVDEEEKRAALRLLAA